MNAKERRIYKRNLTAALNHINQARNFVAEMDAMAHQHRPRQLHDNVRDLRELLGVAYSMALGTRLDVWTGFKIEPPPVKP